MTAKAALHELVDELPEDEAARWLARMERELNLSRRAETVWEIFERAASRIPPEAFEGFPSSDRVDEVVYRLHGR